MRRFNLGKFDQMLLNHLNPISLQNGESQPGQLQSNLT